MIERLLRRWEELAAWKQVAVALPVAVALMFAVHIGPFNQPTGRAASYAVFWGGLMAGAVVAATRAERAKRRDADKRGRK